MSNEINWPLFERVVKVIEDHPQHWDQTKIHCGTSHCFAGWTHVLDLFDKGLIPSILDASGDEDSRCGFLGLTNIQGVDSLNEAERLLGINAKQARWLFDFDRSVDDFRYCITERSILED